jgi:hypothetical protein
MVFVELRMPGLGHGAVTRTPGERDHNRAEGILHDLVRDARFAKDHNKNDS